MSLSQEEHIRNWLEEESDEYVIGGKDNEEGGDEIEPQIIMRFITTHVQEIEEDEEEPQPKKRRCVHCSR
ncbi:unnamed protein product [Parnassius apollo]|uniref:(apollo) hypothetical protein n=1 Tax=Parnassius apollo TaxID=110799 RepID=A0A8S3XHB2_PARAO|nr:unnamed protein product [Parnassius apollo]